MSRWARATLAVAALLAVLWVFRAYRDPDLMIHFQNILRACGF